MTCRLCRRVRALFTRSHRCEACEHAQRAMELHERSTENLTRAALDGIDHSARAERGHTAPMSHNDRVIDEMLAEMLANAERRARRVG